MEFLEIETFFTFKASLCIISGARVLVDLGEVHAKGTQQGSGDPS